MDEPGGVADPHAGPTAQPAGPRPRRRHRLRNTVVGLVALAAVLVALLVVGTQIYVVPSVGMARTLQGCTTGCTSDRVVVDTIAYRFTDPRPGDVVVFQGPPGWQGESELFVKRVVAAGGQTVRCCDDRNRVLVDGQPLDEPYVHFQPGLPDGESQSPFREVRVPADHVWVMGDNRNNSSDSRRYIDDGSSGAVPAARIVGKVRLVILPRDRWQVIDHHDPQQ